MEEPRIEEKSPAESHFRFTPMRPATRRYRAFVLLIAPLIWLVALIVFSRFVHAGGTGGVGAVIAGGSFLLALLFLLPVWIWRAKREERP